VNKISVYFEDIKRFKFDKIVCSERIYGIIEEENKIPGNVCLIYCSDNFLLDINRTYLKHNYNTDIITFNYNENDLISGDLIISIEQVKRNAIYFNQDFSTELYRVIFHGILHLIGYNDKTKVQRKQMTFMENKYLKKFELL
jgi:probable rRNA maturation factor